jgi:cytoskeletal protein CcmA (bactofilin family)
MAIWKESTAPRPNPAETLGIKEPMKYETLPTPEVAVSPVAAPATRTGAAVPGKESLIASDITIEGKIEGGGSVRIAGKFKGDVNVQGDLTIETGAKLTGAVRAERVTIAGELEGNVEEAALVDLQQTGVVIGDVKAGSLTVAAGARLRGQAEFGWDDGKVTRGRKSNGFGVEAGSGS